MNIVFARVGCTDGCALVHERGERDVPAVVDIAKAVVVGHAHFIEEHFIETCATCHLTQWANFDAWCMHVDDEASETFVFWQ